MNLFLLWPFLGFLVNLYIFIKLASLRRTGIVGRSYQLFTIDVIGFFLFFIISRLNSFSEYTLVLLRIESIFWLSIGTVVLNFVYKLLKRKKDKFLNFCIGINIIAVCISLFSDQIIRDYVINEGLIMEKIGSLYIPVTFISVLFSGVFSMILLYKAIKNEKKEIKRKRFLMFLRSLILTFLAGSTSEIILPMFMDEENIPYIGIIAITLFSLYVYNFIIKKGFITLRLTWSLDKYFDHFDKGIVVTDYNNNILKINNTASVFFGLDTNYLNANMDLFIDNISDIEENSEFILNFNKKIFSVVLNNIQKGGDLLGKIFLFTDISVDILDELELRKKNINMGKKLKDEFEKLSKYEDIQKYTERLYTDFFENNNEAMMSIDLSTGIIEDVNIKTKDLFDLNNEDITGMFFGDFFKSVNYNNKYIQNIIKKNIIYDFIDYFSSSKLLKLKLNFNVYKYKGKNKLLCILENINELKDLESKIMKNESFFALSSLISGVVSEYNNLHTVILGYSDKVLNDDSISGKLRILFEKIYNSSKKAYSLTKSLQLFSTDLQSGVINIDLGGIFKPINTIIKKKFMVEGIELEYNIEEKIVFRINAGEIRYIFLSIIIILKNINSTCKKISIFSERNDGQFRLIFQDVSDYIETTNDYEKEICNFIDISKYILKENNGRFIDSYKKANKFIVSLPLLKGELYD